MLCRIIFVILHVIFNKENSLLSVSKSIKGKRDREAYST